MRIMSYILERVVLRPLTAGDSEKTIVWRNDPVTRSLVLGYRFPVTEAMEEAWFEKALADRNGTRILYAVDVRESGEFVGIVHLYDLDWISRTATLGVVIGDARARSKGYGREAVLGVVDIAKEYFNLRKISIDVIDHPDGALAFYEKLGFQAEGVFKSHHYLRSKYYDIVRMALFL
jgi:RimJ/RimL family protein N-acetyltransferase